MLEDENPGLIFEAEDGDDPTSLSHIPLVLIHDGGGTCFSYYCLDPLNRPTYEIHNPRFYTQQPWTGGIPEMAEHYVSLIHKAVPRGRILLGGWSFGGILSLAVSRLLADDPVYKVLGIVMVDSICPGVVKAEDWERGIGYPGQFSSTTSEETKMRVNWCFSDAIRMIAEYECPSWDEDGKSGDAAEARPGANGPRNGSKCPPAILLRATETVPTESESRNRVDIVRGDRSLGWNSYRAGFFQEIIDVTGHHFNLFAFENIEQITQIMIEACKKLEGYSR